MTPKKKFLPASKRVYVRDSSGNLVGQELRMSRSEVMKRAWERRRLSMPKDVYKPK